MLNIFDWLKHTLLFQPLAAGILFISTFQIHDRLMFEKEKKAVNRWTTDEVQVLINLLCIWRHLQMATQNEFTLLYQQEQGEVKEDNAAVKKV